MQWATVIPFIFSALHVKLLSHKGTVCKNSRIIKKYEWKELIKHFAYKQAYKILNNWSQIDQGRGKKRYEK